MADILQNRTSTALANTAPTNSPSPRQPQENAERPYLDSLIRGVSEIFDDRDSIDANIVRAHRLQEGHGLDEETMAQCVFRARSLVKERRLRHRGSTVRRPGAYFFTILEDLAAEANGHAAPQNRPIPSSDYHGRDSGHLRAKRPA